MASKQTYPCFACRKAGYEVQVFLDGKDEQGRTKYLNEDGTRHTHYNQQLQRSQQQEQKQQYHHEEQEGSSFEVESLQERIKEKLQQEQQQQQYFGLSEESFQRGISAFTMISSLIGLVEQTQKLLITIDGKLDRMLNLADRNAVRQ